MFGCLRPVATCADGVRAPRGKIAMLACSTTRGLDSWFGLESLLDGRDWWDWMIAVVENNNILLLQNNNVLLLLTNNIFL